MKHIEAFRRYENSTVRHLNILLPSYCKNVLLEIFPIIVIRKQLRRHSSYVIERLLRGHMSGIFTCPLKLLENF